MLPQVGGDAHQEARTLSPTPNRQTRAGHPQLIAGLLGFEPNPARSLPHDLFESRSSRSGWRLTLMSVAGHSSELDQGEPGVALHTMRVYDQAMSKRTTTMSRRLNISLPEETVRLLDRVAEKGERSHIIAEAVTMYVTEIGKARLRKLVKERALARAELDLQIAEEWFPVDQEAWDGKRE